MQKFTKLNKIMLLAISLGAGVVNFILPFASVPIFATVLLLLYLSRSRLIYVVGFLAVISFILAGVDIVTITSVVIIVDVFFGGVFVFKNASPQLNTLCACTMVVELSFMPIVGAMMITSSNVKEYTINYMEDNYNTTTINNVAKLYYTFFTPEDDYVKVSSTSSEYETQVKEKFFTMLEDLASDSVMFFITGLASFTMIVALCLSYFLFPLMFGEYKRQIAFDKINFTSLDLTRKILPYGLLPALVFMVIGSYVPMLSSVTLSITNSLLILPTSVYALSYLAYAFSFASNKAIRGVLYTVVVFIGLSAVIFLLLQTLLSILALAVCIINAKKLTKFALT